jgi:hypothetical protein
MGGARFGLILAGVSLLGLIAIEFGVYRPARARMAAAEASLKSVQAQVMATERRRLGDVKILEAFGANEDPAAMSRLLGSESGLMYLNRLIDASRLARIDFHTESGRQDGPFYLERFFVTLEGTGAQLLEFVRTVEANPRLAMFDQLRFDPEAESTTLRMRARVIIYSLPDGGTP